MFRNDYILKGRHATYAKLLCESTQIRQGSKENIIGVFRYGIDLFQVAPLIGVSYNKRAEIDTKSNDKYTIQANAVINQQENLETIYRLVMLSEKSSDLTNDEKVHRAFKEDEHEEKSKLNMNLFDEYVRGGIDWLYERFDGCGTSQETYLDEIPRIVNDFYIDFIDTLEV